MQPGIGAQQRAVDADGHQWWQHSVFYELYPRSFADSNNDGIGDLKGITAKLDYLKELGVDAIRITPCFPSPQVDFGYDVSDYETIDPMYGTLQDFDRGSTSTESFVAHSAQIPATVGRNLAMLICAICVLPDVYAYRGHRLWPTVLLIGLDAAALQRFSANLFTAASDMLPREAVASALEEWREDSVEW